MSSIMDNRLVYLSGAIAMSAAHRYGFLTGDIKSQSLIKVIDSSADLITAVRPPVQVNRLANYPQQIEQR